MIEQCITGIQHIGIPTNDMHATVTFYRKLGFETVYETVLEDENCQVCFLK
ncbi:MAG: VOC family protein, partial [Treponema sp.]|nr:VOC family protein [Treponema sp.]